MGRKPGEVPCPGNREVEEVLFVEEVGSDEAAGCLGGCLSWRNCGESGAHLPGQRADPPQWHLQGTPHLRTRITVRSGKQTFC